MSNFNVHTESNQSRKGSEREKNGKEKKGCNKKEVRDVGKSQGDLSKKERLNTTVAGSTNLWAVYNLCMLVLQLELLTTL